MHQPLRSLCSALLYACTHPLPSPSLPSPPLPFLKSPKSTSTPNILLVLPATPHTLDHRLRLLGRDASLLADQLRQHNIDLARHICRIAADVKAGFVVLEEVVDFDGVLFEPVLDVDFRALFAGEGGDELEGGAEVGGEFLGGERRLVEVYGGQRVECIIGRG